jgi:hypothetical protein
VLTAKPPLLKDLKYSIEIDQEGYPVFSGLRVDDEELLQDIFQNLQRALPENLRSKILTCLESKKWAWVDAFDAPLVAQFVEYQEDADTVKWIFLGGVESQLRLDDIEVDEWNRFHAYVGPFEIPATLSRKAHASFLNLLSHRKKMPEFKFFREGSSLKSEDWNNVYLANETGWELAAPHPYLAEGLQSLQPLLPENPKILVAGAGRGHDAVFLSQTIKNSQVCALDFAPEALKDFQKQYSSFNRSNLEYRQEDVFAFLEKQPAASWDMVFEHTFFCAISPLHRKKYVDEVLRILKPQGLWLGLFFLLEHRGGPPFALTQWELREFVRKSFAIKKWERISHKSPKGRLHSELWTVFCKQS